MICETVSRLFQLYDTIPRVFDHSWLTDVLLMLRSYSSVQLVLCSLVCHLVSSRSSSLVPSHVHGLAAILFHWANFTNCSVQVRVDSTTSNSVTAIDEHLLGILPMTTEAEMLSSLQLCVSYLAYSLKTEVGRRFFTENGNPDDGGVKIPPTIYRVVSYLGPRLYTELQSVSLSPRTTRHPVTSSSAVLSQWYPTIVGQLVNCTSAVWAHVVGCRMSFDDWVRHERLFPCSRSDYHHFVVFSGWHVPDCRDQCSPTATDSSVRHPQMGEFCLVLADNILNILVNSFHRSSASCLCCRPTSRDKLQLPAVLVSLLQVHILLLLV